MRRLSGLLADRPSPRTAVGARYYATDEQQVYVNYGSEWLAKTALDPADVAAFISGPNLAARPMVPGNYLGYLWTDAETGNQYEAFPDAWALVGNLTPSDGGGAFDISALPAASDVGDADLIPIDQEGTQKKAAKSLLGGGGGVVDGQQIFDGSHVLAFDAGARTLYASDGTTVALDWSSRSLYDAAGNRVARWADVAGSDGIEFGYHSPGVGGKLVIASDNVATYSEVSAYVNSNLWLDLYNDVGSGIKSARINANYLGVNSLQSFAGVTDNVPNIDLANRRLFASDGTTEILDYSDPAVAPVSRFGNPAHDALQVLRANAANDGFEFADPAGGGGVVDGQQIFDGSHALAFDAGAHKLYADDGTTPILDWGSGVRIKDGSNVVAIDASVAKRSLYDSFGHTALNYSNRRLTAGDTTVMVDWSNASELNLFGGAASVTPDGHYHGDGSELTGAGVIDGQQIFDGSHALAFDAGARKLYSPDGTTVAADWSTPLLLSFFDGFCKINGDTDTLQLAGDITNADNDTVFALGSRTIFDDDNQPIFTGYQRQLNATDGSVVVDWSSGIKLPGLPTSDPSVSGQLWNDAGTLKVSA